MKIHFSRFSRLAMVALLAGSIQAKAEGDSLIPVKKVEAMAACATLAEKIGAAQSSQKVEVATKLSQLCDEGLVAIYENIRQLGNEYFVAGLGLFLSLEGNTPPVKRVSVGGRLAGGVSGFLTNNTGFRFTALVNVSGSLQYIHKGDTTPFEPQIGIIVYLGGPKTKSINQLNGLYGGGGVEFPNVFSAVVQNRTSLTFNLLANKNGNIAVVGLKSFNAGSNMVAPNIQVMHVNNVTRTGAGANFTEIFSGIGTEFSDIVDSAYGSVSAYMSSVANSIWK